MTGGSGKVMTLSSMGGTSITLFGGSGNDTLSSSDGTSITLIGGTGNDSLSTTGTDNSVLQAGSERRQSCRAQERHEHHPARRQRQRHPHLQRRHQHHPDWRQRQRYADVHRRQRRPFWAAVQATRQLTPDRRQASPCSAGRATTRCRPPAATASPSSAGGQRHCRKRSTGGERRNREIVKRAATACPCLAARATDTLAVDRRHQHHLVRRQRATTRCRRPEAAASP